jgi:hypothetical protein
MLAYPGSGFGQAVSDSGTSEHFKQEIVSHPKIEKIISDWKKPNLTNLKRLHTNLHKEVLVNYAPNTSLEETLNNDRFNCVTGTLIYGTILESLNVPYEIIETTKHTFLIVHLSKSVLLESTEPNWFKMRIGKKNVLALYQDYMEAYKSKYNVIQTADYTANNEALAIERNITLEALYGLLFYNRAIDQYYNQMDHRAALRSLQTAKSYYPYERIEIFERLINQSVSYVACSLP